MITAFIEQLCTGNPQIQKYLREAWIRWEKIHEATKDYSLAELARDLPLMQRQFEQTCGDSLMGQTVMALTAFGTRCKDEDTIEQKAQTVENLALAFEESSCSIEVKNLVKKLSTFYGIEG